MFVPSAHELGHTQADFGEAAEIIGGADETAHCLVMALPQSDAFVLIVSLNAD